MTNFIPPSFSFKGNKIVSKSLSGKALSLYNKISREAERAGINSISRTKVLEDGSTITITSTKQANYNNRAGSIVITSPPQSSTTTSTSGLDILIKDTNSNNLYIPQLKGNTVTLQQVDPNRYPISKYGFSWIGGGKNNRLFCSLNNSNSIQYGGKGVNIGSNEYAVASTDQSYAAGMAFDKSRGCVLLTSFNPSNPLYNTLQCMVVSSSFKENRKILFTISGFSLLNTAIFSYDSTESVIKVITLSESNKITKFTYTKGTDGVYGLSSTNVIASHDTPTGTTVITEVPTGDPAKAYFTTVGSIDYINAGPFPEINCTFNNLSIPKYHFTQDRNITDKYVRYGYGYYEKTFQSTENLAVSNSFDSEFTYSDAGFPNPLEDYFSNTKQLDFNGHTVTSDSHSVSNRNFSSYDCQFIDGDIKVVNIFLNDPPTLTSANGSVDTQTYNSVRSTKVYIGNSVIWSTTSSSPLTVKLNSEEAVYGVVGIPGTHVTTYHSPSSVGGLGYRYIYNDELYILFIKDVNSKRRLLFFPIVKGIVKPILLLEREMDAILSYAVKR